MCQTRDETAEIIGIPYGSPAVQGRYANPPGGWGERCLSGLMIDP